jgi:hypothetical protein
VTTACSQQHQANLPHLERPATPSV